MEECSEGSITSLPDELITLILLNNKPQDIISFGSTCKQFYDSITKNEYLWKVKYTEILPEKITKFLKKNCSVGMLREVKNVYKLKRKIYTELLLMSPKFYLQVEEVSLKQIGNFFAFATESNISYYYTIYILQDVVEKGYKRLNNFDGYDPLYNLTIIYYAKKVLCYLFHTFLSIKWVREFKRNNLTPLIVITIFLQWINCEQFYSDEDVDKKIQGVVTQVKKILNDTHPNRQGQNNKKYTEREVLQAITQTIYMRDNFSITEDVQLSSFDICKVIDEGNGIGVVYGAIYESVAKYFGIKCTLITFSNHLFLEWRDSQQNKKQYIDLHTGQLKPRNCPYSSRGNYVYDAFSLVQYLFVFMVESGTFIKCQTRYAMQISNFLSYENQYENNSYRNFFKYLSFQHIGADLINMPLDMEYLHDSQLQIILTLSNLNEEPKCIKNTIVPKKHPPNVLYPVGMVCFHEVHHYLCIILEWELDASKIKLPVQGSQPFYLVMATDQSERYVAQEHIKPVTPTPFRLIKFEPEIARNFTHFDGYTYVLNQEKKMEYPNEEEVIEVYKSQLLRATASDVLA